MKRFALFSTVMAVVVIVGYLGHFAYLHMRAKRERSARTKCIGNLLRLGLGKIQYQEESGVTNGYPVTVAELGDLAHPYDLICPLGDRYIVGPIGVSPMCTHSNLGHRWSWSH